MLISLAFFLFLAVPFALPSASHSVSTRFPPALIFSTRGCLVCLSTSYTSDFLCFADHSFLLFEVRIPFVQIIPILVASCPISCFLSYIFHLFAFLLFAFHAYLSHSNTDIHRSWVATRITVTLVTGIPREMAAGFDNPAHPNAMDTSEDFFVDQTQVTHDVNGPALVRSVQEPEVDQILTESSSKKRKSLSPVQDADASTGLDYESTGPSKRARRDGAASPESKISHFPDWSTLPAEVWHSILSACPPKTLGNLLRVNKLLNSYLDPASGAVLKEPLPPPAKSVLKPMEPNAIWRGARRRFWPTMPAPLSGKTELDMWRLCCSTACQFCGKQNARQASPPLDSFRVGPGGNGVACIWEFRIRCCGSCLLDRSLRVRLYFCRRPCFLSSNCVPRRWTLFFQIPRHF